MEVVAATFRRASESRRVHSLPGARPPTRPGPCPMHYSALTEPWCSVSPSYQSGGDVLAFL